MAKTVGQHDSDCRARMHSPKIVTGHYPALHCSIAAQIHAHSASSPHPNAVQLLTVCALSREPANLSAVPQNKCFVIPRQVHKTDVAHVAHSTCHFPLSDVKLARRVASLFMQRAHTWSGRCRIHASTTRGGMVAKRLCNDCNAVRVKNSNEHKF